MSPYEDPKPYASTYLRPPSPTPGPESPPEPPDWQMQRGSYGSGQRSIQLPVYSEEEGIDIAMKTALSGVLGDIRWYGAPSLESYTALKEAASYVSDLMPEAAKFVKELRGFALRDTPKNLRGSAAGDYSGKYNAIRVPESQIVQSPQRAVDAIVGHETTHAGQEMSSRADFEAHWRKLLPNIEKMTGQDAADAYLHLMSVGYPSEQLGRMGGGNVLLQLAKEAEAYKMSNKLFGQTWSSSSERLIDFYEGLIGRK